MDKTKSSKISPLANHEKKERNISFTQAPDTGVKGMGDNLYTRSVSVYALFGNPVTHSKSPLIHHLFAKQTQQKMIYSAMQIEPGCLAKALDDFQSKGGKGVNITSPFKQEAFSLVDSVSQRAQLAQAINTIQFTEDGQRFGDNTDGIGLIKDLTVNHKINLAGKRILILGAGGAARGVLGSLLIKNPAEMIIANRTADKAYALAKEFAHLNPVQACPLPMLDSYSFDLVINATSAGLQGQTLSLPHTLLTNTFCYDMAYGKVAIPFLQQAKKQGARARCDGLGMLIEQAAESFYLWRKIRPDTQNIIIYP